MTRRILIPRHWSLLLVVLSVVVISWALFNRECASGGAMGGVYRECTCHGWERVDYDNTAADGPRRTICLGWISARTCYQNRGGMEVPCEETGR